MHDILAGGSPRVLEHFLTRFAWTEVIAVGTIDPRCWFRFTLSLSHGLLLRDDAARCCRYQRWWSLWPLEVIGRLNGDLPTFGQCSASCRFTAWPYRRQVNARFPTSYPLPTTSPRSCFDGRSQLDRAARGLFLNAEPVLNAITPFYPHEPLFHAHRHPCLSKSRPAPQTNPFRY